ncbi:Ohr family peroxiredoxin [Aeromonas crassostreae]
MKSLYRTQALAQAGRNGEVHTQDGTLQLALALPAALGGNGQGNNPEQLLAAGYAACFSNALLHVAKAMGTPLASAPVATTVDLLARADGTFTFAILLEVTLAGELAEQIVRQAHQTCPFANAMRGNVATRLLLNGRLLEETK